MPTKIINKKIVVPLFLAALLVITVISGGIYSKYVRSQEADGHISAPNFYFESDYLTADGKEYTLNAGTETVTFSLMNYADELRVSEVDVVYTVNVTCDGEDFSKITYKIGENTVTDKKMVNGNFAKVTVTLSNLESGKTYTVTATGKGGFKKTLSATFKVNAAETNVYKHISQTEHCVLLTVWTENVNGNAKIELPEGLIPDNTDTRMSTWLSDKNSYEDETAYTAYSSHTYRFFKETNGTQYTIDNFTVTVNGKNAIEGTP